MLDLFIDIIAFILIVDVVLSAVKMVEGARNRAIERKIKENE